MDIISQLQEQVNVIASLTFNMFGTLQRDAPPVQLSQCYPEPPPNASSEVVDISEQTKLMSAALVKAAKNFEVLVATLPTSDGGEEGQLKRIAELESENDSIGQQLQTQLHCAEQELKKVRELFATVADDSINHFKTSGTL